MSRAAFTKLFSGITESTVWSEPLATRITWITMLAMADARGRVSASVPGLARRARVTVRQVEAALACFLAPDRYSRTPEYEGRRIEVIDGGWRLLNHAKYRELRDDEDRREYQREWVKGKRRGKVSTGMSTDVDNVDRSRPPSTQAEAEAEAEEEGRAVNPLGHDVAPIEFETAWQELPKRSGNNPKAAALRAWRSRLRDGVDPKTMIDGARRYRKFCEQTGKLGSETVMRGSTFFGPDRPFEQAFTPPAERRALDNAAVRAEAARLIFGDGKQQPRDANHPALPAPTSTGAEPPEPPAPEAPGARENQANGEAQSASQERDRMLDAFALDHGLARRSGEAPSAFRARVTIEMARQTREEAA